MQPAQKPFYRFLGRRANPPFTDVLTFQNQYDHDDTVSFSEWWYRQYWRTWWNSV